MSMPVISDDVGLSVPYTADELMAIVDVHNQERGNVSPTAADMEYMVSSRLIIIGFRGWGGGDERWCDAVCIYDRGGSGFCKDGRRGGGAQF